MAEIGAYDAVNQRIYVIPILIIICASNVIQILVLKSTLFNLLFTTPITKSTTNGPKKLHWFPRYLSLCAIIGFSICNITQFIALLLYIFDIDILIGWFAGDSYVWFIGKYIMYPLFSGRLFITFKKTQYQYKWYNIGFLSCVSLLILQLIGNFFWNYYYSLNQFDLVLLWSIIIYATDPLYCIIITYMFISKLAKLKRDIMQLGQNNIRLSNENLIKIMSKYSINVFFGVATSSIAIILSCFRWYYINSFWMWISSVSVSIDCAISSIAILFCFPFAHKFYTKFCSKCDQILRSQYYVERQLSEHIDDHQNKKKTDVINTLQIKDGSNNKHDGIKDKSTDGILNNTMMPPLH